MGFRTDSTENTEQSVALPKTWEGLLLPGHQKEI